MGVMHILNTTGHTDVTWDTDDMESTEAATIAFMELQMKGYFAFERLGTDQVELGRRLDSFDPSVEEIFWLRPLVGG